MSMKLSMEYKHALLVTDTVTSASLSLGHIQHDGWGTLDEAYKFAQVQEESVTHTSISTSTADRVHNQMKSLLTDALYEYHTDAKAYWEQFGFLNESTLDSFVNTLLPHISIHQNNDVYHFSSLLGDENGEDNV